MDSLNRSRKPLNLRTALGEELSPSGFRRRTFLKILGSGVMVTVFDSHSLSQTASSSPPVAARLFLNRDGSFTAFSGKVEEGQGARAELTQAAAEELRVSVSSVHLTMADTDLVPDDGITAGSRTTPINVPEMRQAAATARDLLTRLAADRWRVDPKELAVSDGIITNPVTGQKMGYADLTQSSELERLFREKIRSDVILSQVSDWKVLGRSVMRPNARSLVTGEHKFPSDIARPQMLYGRLLRPPSYGAVLESINLSAAKAMRDVVVIRENQFVGFLAPSSHQAKRAMEAAAKTASWSVSEQLVSSASLHAHLREKAQWERARVTDRGSTENALAGAAKVLKETYTLAYIQHAPMEPRAAVAEWANDNLTVWVGCDNPFRAQATLADEFGISRDKVRVIVPDMGGGFGGKHTAEAALEAARLARKSGRCVSIRWTREEEFTWAYCRPAAVIECRGGLDSSGRLNSWEFTNINAGGAAIETPYAIPNTRIVSASSDSPIRQGSYRCLAATGNNFARESFMDELAAAAGTEPLEFRLKHLSEKRLRRVLEEAAHRFGWKKRLEQITPELGVGLACGTEKNSVVAACVEVSIDRKQGRIKVLEVCEVFECGPILNPENLESQVEGCILMGLGGALMEAIQFEKGKILNPKFSKYRVPRFSDVPKIDVHLIDNRDIEPAGGGETPIVAIAPAIGNAIFAATGRRIRSMPIRTQGLTES